MHAAPPACVIRLASASKRNHSMMFPAMYACCWETVVVACMLQQLFAQPVLNLTTPAGAKVKVFDHNDPAHLEAVLRSAIAEGQPRTGRPWKKIVSFLRCHAPFACVVCEVLGPLCSAASMRWLQGIEPHGIEPHKFTQPLPSLPRIARSSSLRASTPWRARWCGSRKSWS